MTGHATAVEYVKAEVFPYRDDRGKRGWGWRCPGSSTCDGWIGLDHGSESAARSELDRPVAEEHGVKQ